MCLEVNDWFFTVTIISFHLPTFNIWFRHVTFISRGGRVDCCLGFVSVGESNRVTFCTVEEFLNLKVTSLYSPSLEKNVVLVDKNYIRPLDVNTLLGNAAKARKELKWKPQINIHTLIDEMITEEMNILNNDQ